MQDFIEYLDKLNMSYEDSIRLKTVRQVGYYYGLTDEEIDSVLPFSEVEKGS